jgi:NAD(P)-dependent dehydrogenase (short-subunit alcohol dehydrogenase family)
MSPEPASAAAADPEARPKPVALVTGGGKGVGAAIAHALAADGVRVALMGRDRAALEETAHASGGLVVLADVTDPAAVERGLSRVREAWGSIGILVHNAGIAPSAPLKATTDEIWEQTMAVNVTAGFRLARALVPAMVDSGWGRIVNVASVAGLTGFAYTSAYCASKHALVGLTRALAAELARTRVTVNAVCPGFLETEMTARTLANITAKTGKSPEEARRALEELSPQRRLFQVEEVAHVVRMLCADDARGIHGQAISVCGGQVMR